LLMQITKELTLEKMEPAVSEIVKNAGWIYPHKTSECLEKTLLAGQNYSLRTYQRKPYLITCSLPAM
jgi:hypothetical protein